MQTYTYYHITPIQNLDAIKLEGLKPQQGPRCKYAVANMQATAKAAERTHALYLFDELEVAKTAIRTWFGAWEQAHSTDKQLAVLEVVLTAAQLVDARHDTIDSDGEEWETIIFKPVPPENIKVLWTETPHPVENWADSGYDK